MLSSDQSLNGWCTVLLLLTMCVYCVSRCCRTSMSCSTATSSPPHRTRDGRTASTPASSSSRPATTRTNHYSTSLWQLALSMVSDLFQSLLHFAMTIGTFDGERFIPIITPLRYDNWHFRWWAIYTNHYSTSLWQLALSMVSDLFQSLLHFAMTIGTFDGERWWAIYSNHYSTSLWQLALSMVSDLFQSLLHFAMTIGTFDGERFIPIITPLRYDNWHFRWWAIFSNHYSTSLWQLALSMVSDGERFIPIITPLRYDNWHFRWWAIYSNHYSTSLWQLALSMVSDLYQSLLHFAMTIGTFDGERFIPIITPLRYDNWHFWWSAIFSNHYSTSLWQLALSMVSDLFQSLLHFAMTIGTFDGERFIPIITPLRYDNWHFRWWAIYTNHYSTSLWQLALSMVSDFLQSLLHFAMTIGTFDGERFSPIITPLRYDNWHFRWWAIFSNHYSTSLWQLALSMVSDLYQSLLHFAMTIGTFDGEWFSPIITPLRYDNWHFRWWAISPIITPLRYDNWHFRWWAIYSNHYSTSLWQLALSMVSDLYQSLLHFAMTIGTFDGERFLQSLLHFAMTIGTFDGERFIPIITPLRYDNWHFRWWAIYTNHYSTSLWQLALSMVSDFSNHYSTSLWQLALSMVSDFLQSLLHFAMTIGTFDGERFSPIITPLRYDNWHFRWWAIYTNHYSTSLWQLALSMVSDFSNHYSTSLWQLALSMVSDLYQSLLHFAMTIGTFDGEQFIPIISPLRYDNWHFWWWAIFSYHYSTCAMTIGTFDGERFSPINTPLRYDNCHGSMRERFIPSITPFHYDNWHFDRWAIFSR